MNIRATIFAALISTLPFGAHAQSATESYPDRPVKVVLAGSPGSSIDTVARIVAPAMSEVLGQPLVLENVDGAGGTMGATQVAQAPNDGYTIGIVSANYALSPSLYSSLPYDSATDIEPVTLLTSGVIALAVNPNKLQATTVSELVEAARTSSEPIAYGSPGVGSMIHLAFELFADMTGTAWLHIPYRGTSQYMTDLISGEVAAGFIVGTQGKSYFESGQLQPIGITTNVRNPIIPDVAPLSEVGVPGYELTSWVGMIAPAGMPEGVMTRINEAAVSALADPEVQNRLGDLGYSLLPMSPSDAATAVNRDIERFGDLIGRLNIAPQ